MFDLFLHCIILHNLIEFIAHHVLSFWNIWNCRVRDRSWHEFDDLIEIWPRSHRATYRWRHLSCYFVFVILSLTLFWCLLWDGSVGGTIFKIMSKYNKADCTNCWSYALSIMFHSEFFDAVGAEILFPQVLRSVQGWGECRMDCSETFEFRYCLNDVSRAPMTNPILLLHFFESRHTCVFVCSVCSFVCFNWWPQLSHELWIRFSNQLQLYKPFSQLCEGSVGKEE